MSVACSPVRCPQLPLGLPCPFRAVILGDSTMPSKSRPTLTSRLTDLSDWSHPVCLTIQLCGHSSVTHRTTPRALTLCRWPVAPPSCLAKAFPLVRLSLSAPGHPRASTQPLTEPWLSGLSHHPLRVCGPPITHSSCWPPTSQGLTGPCQGVEQTVRGGLQGCGTQALPPQALLSPAPGPQPSHSRTLR